jgi:23S rRNA pseudouridine2605 synthase
MRPPRRAPRPSAGLARILSKRGLCSRSEAREFIRAGRVRVNGVVVRDAERAVGERDRIELDGQAAAGGGFVHVMLNKPRGLVTSTADEQGRETVFGCFAGAGLPRLIAVGRLDKASEGLLLFTNDTAWAARITDPAAHLDKVYHVQVNLVAGEDLLRRLEEGAVCEGEPLRVKAARLLRQGGKNSWIEIVLDEGRNRHIRRLLAAFGIEVLRLVRVQVGALPLGDLPKGGWRHLTAAEAAALGG